MNPLRFGDIVAGCFPGARLEASAPLTGGVSADVHRLDVRFDDGRTARLVLRAHGASHSGHAADLEYSLLEALHRGGLPVPEPLKVDTSGRMAATPFVVMAYVEGTSEIPAAETAQRLAAMADVLARIHGFPAADLPALPSRLDPLPEVFDFLPADREWDALRAHLHARADTAFVGAPVLLHGDFWPENLLWKDGTIAAILDWEDAAIGDPLSDLAAARVELRYQLGASAMERLTADYARHREVDRDRLALWQVYVAAAAQHFMGEWGLPPAREAHMRAEAMASIRDAAAVLLADAGAPPDDDRSASDASSRRS